MDRKEHMSGTFEPVFRAPIYRDYQQKWEQVWQSKRIYEWLRFLSVCCMFLTPLAGDLGWFVFLLAGVIAWRFTNLSLNAHLPSLDPQKDVRAPYLLLRSFHASALRSRVSEKIRISSVQRITTTHSLAEELETKQCLGPVVVLQEEPRTKSTINEREWTAEYSPPNLIVLQESDAQWLQTVEYLMKRCRAVIFLPGVSPSITYEIQTLRRLDLFNRVIVLMPPASKSWIDQQTENQKMQSAWGKVQKRLKSKLALNLPRYNPNGLLYLPNQDLSVMDSYELGHNFENFNEALWRLSRIGDSECSTLSELLIELRENGFKRESKNVFCRTI